MKPISLTSPSPAAWLVRALPVPRRNGRFPDNGAPSVHQPRAALYHRAVTRLLDYIYCLSLSFDAPFAYLLSAAWLHRIALWFARGGATLLLEHATTLAALPPALWWRSPIAEQPSHEDSTHALLR